MSGDAGREIKAEDMFGDDTADDGEAVGGEVGAAFGAVLQGVAGAAVSQDCEVFESCGTSE